MARTRAATAPSRPRHRPTVRPHRGQTRPGHHHRSGHQEPRERRVSADGPGSTGTVTATDKHPFWAASSNTWLNAGDLLPGTQLRTAEGTQAGITAVERWTALNQRVHNLTIAELRTYYVLAGKTPVLVHNCNGRDPNTGGLRDAVYDRIEKCPRHACCRGGGLPGRSACMMAQAPPLTT
ncbi:polymorphic toxin-type HINT domain-containing protein [Streptomyces wuyuanensis]|uniref:polymorphic toxin-type HINT domain-containing protein n=1 Tax=Streptomyces wuyuanensis TaxID=1196353 RepID=UPI003D702C1C